MKDEYNERTKLNYKGEEEKEKIAANRTTEIAEASAVAAASRETENNKMKRTRGME